ncbi:sphingosine kinase 2-like [Ctenocephalides felis]|uniref:sphingosine kinase 2-like n=1 Tax=Ctenocephalides felis TaxID=7515 RepID=UPI000E6E13C8|nr:sphingosine kinase 2-like [Ctenocephalides felis]
MGKSVAIIDIDVEPYSPKPVLGAALAVVKGRSAPMDLVRVETTNKIMYSFLSVGWGLLADIDIESERLRAIGAQRFTIWSLLRLATLRTYKGTVSYLPVSKELLEKRGLMNESDSESKRYINSNRTNNLTHSISQNLKIDDSDDNLQSHNDWSFLDLNSSAGACAACGGSSAGTCDLCDSGFGDAISLETESPPPKGSVQQQQRSSETGSYMEGRQRLDSWYSTTSRRSTYYSAAGVSSYHSVDGDTLCGDNSTIGGSEGSVMMHGPASRIPALTAKVPDEWVTLKGEFVMVHANYQTFIGADCCTPKSTLDDGIIWLIIIKGGVSRQRLLAFLLGLSSGTHVDGKNFTNLNESGNAQDPYVSMTAVSAFRITPDDVSRGHVTVDGESVPCGPVQGEVFPGLVRIVVP